MSVVSSSVLKFSVDALPGNKKTFGLDIGGSLIKLAFIPDKAENHIQDGVVTVQLFTLTMDGTDDAIQMIKDNCKLPERGPHKIPSCGIGCGKLIKHLHEKFNIRLDTGLEHEYILNSLKFMKCHLGPGVIFHPVPTAIIEFEQLVKSKISEIRDRSLADEHNVIDSRSEGRVQSHHTGSDGFLSIGSGTFIMQAGKGASFQTCCAMGVSGKALLALGKLLTGVQTMEELINLARQGDGNAVHELGADIKCADANDVYQSVIDEHSIFMFGKLANMNVEEIGNVRRNDIARGLLSFIAETTFAFAAQFCSASNITHLYIGGTLTDSFQEFREDLYKCFVHRKYWYPKFLPEDITFLKQGSYMGAIGLLIS